MKKLFLTLLLAFTGFISAQAQMWLGGSVNTEVNKGTQTFTVAPDLGYSFPETSFSIGCALEYTGTFQKGIGFDHAMTVSPYLRYDICDFEERFSFFVDLAADIDVIEFNDINVGLLPGVSFDLSDHWSAEFSYGFLGFEREKTPSGQTIRRFVLDLESAATTFGINYIF